MAQTAAPSTPGANSSAQGDAQAKSTPAASNIPPCDKPGGMSLSRIVEIDTTGGPGFGFEHFQAVRLPPRQGSGSHLR
jgi:hypothetical protein